MSIMGFVIVILIFIVGIGLVNEKWIHLQSDISLVLFSLIVSLALLLIDMAGGVTFGTAASDCQF